MDDLHREAVPAWLDGVVRQKLDNRWCRHAIKCWIYFTLPESLAMAFLTLSLALSLSLSPLEANGCFLLDDSQVFRIWINFVPSRYLYHCLAVLREIVIVSYCTIFLLWVQSLILPLISVVEVDSEAQSFMAHWSNGIVFHGDHVDKVKTSLLHWYTPCTM